MATVHIFGSIICDLVGTGPTLPKAGETVLGVNFAKYPGGKGANQAVASHRAGTQTILYGATGDDDTAKFMRKAISDAGLTLDHISTTASPTGTALVMVGPDTNQIMVIPGANHDAVWPPSAPTEISAGDVLLTQGECTPSATEAFLKNGNDAGALTILNAAPASADFLTAAKVTDILILNEVEAAFFAQTALSAIPTQADLENLNNKLGRSASQPLIVTLGPDGLCALIDGTYITQPAPNVKAIDTVGAGDCFCGYLAAQLAQGKNLQDGLAIASKAASISVTRAGAIPSIPRLEELT